MNSSNTLHNSPSKLEIKKAKSRGASPTKVGRAGNNSNTHTIHLEARKDYSFKRIIGKGAEGVVYEAVRRSDGKYFAIKEVQQDHQSFYQLKQVLREVSILRRLSAMPGAAHHIVVLEDLLWCERKGTDPACFYLVMEFAEGVTLKEFLDQAQNKKISLSTEDATTLSFNFLQAVEFIHKAGVLHRDIKPANLMVGPGLTVRLIDFGLSRTLNSNSIYDDTPVPKCRQERKDLASSLLESRKQRKKKERQLSPHVQTRIYRSPEVALLENEYSFPSDIWSVGCIIGEILQCQSKYKLDGREPFARYIFKSTSCYPLSPCRDLQEEGEVLDRLEDLDLLRVILRVLGDQKSYDLSFLSSQSSMKFAHKNYSGQPRVEFDAEFEGTPKGLCKLLQKTLMFNPFFRYTASDLLEMEVFSDLQRTLKDQAEESPSSKAKHERINLKFDEAGEYDYEACESRNWKVADLMQVLLKEVQGIKQTSLKYRQP